MEACRHVRRHEHRHLYEAHLAVRSGRVQISLVVNAAAIGMKCVGILDYKRLSDDKASLTHRLLHKAAKLNADETAAIEQQAPCMHIHAHTQALVHARSLAHQLAYSHARTCKCTRTDKDTYTHAHMHTQVCFVDTITV